MQIEIVGEHNNIAYVHSDIPILRDADTAADLIGIMRHEKKCGRVILDKSAVSEDFFILSTRVAGEILQKFVNYHMKMAIVGDFSQYTSQPLHDFFHESNSGRDFFFVETAEEAMEKLL